MSSTAKKTKAIEIFYSYSHTDQHLRDLLEIQLSLLERQGLISEWHDRKIKAGQVWLNEIDNHLNTADIILLLISPDFIASDYCYSVEMKRALERHNAAEACVIPIILRPVHWEEAPFGKIQALPLDGKPVTSRSWHDLDEAFFDVAGGIREAVVNLQKLKISPKMRDDRQGEIYRTDERISLPKPNLTKPFNPYKVRDEWIEYITSSLKETIEKEDYLDFDIDDSHRSFAINNSIEYREIRISCNQETIYSLVIQKYSEGKSSGGSAWWSPKGITFLCAEGRTSFSSKLDASGDFKWDKQKETVVLELMDWSLLFHSGGTKEYTKEELLLALWANIRSVIESSVLW